MTSAVARLGNTVAAAQMSVAKNLIAESASDSDSEPEICINKEYAEKYENWRKKEEYQKLKNKYGENVVSESSAFSGSDSETDSDPELLNEQLNQEIFDEDFLRVYGALKSKDPRIYDDKFSFHSEKQPDGAGPSRAAKDVDEDEGKRKKEKKMTLIDYHMTLMKERDGKTEEDEDLVKRHDPSYYEKLDDIRKGFKKIIDQSDNESSDEELFRNSGKKTVSSKGQAGQPESNDSDIEFLKKYWTDENVDENEKFIRDFILKKKYLDKPLRVVSSADKIVGSSKDDTGCFFGNMPEGEEQESEEDDLKKDAIPANGTAKFRFQEEGAAEIKRYPRVVDSARDLSEKEERAKKRKEKRERKKKEKEEELMRFTKLKKDQEVERVKLLIEASKNKKISESDPNLESLIDAQHEFDPEKYDEFMKKMYDNEYYKEGESEDAVKPEFGFIEGIDNESEDESEGESEKSNHQNDEDDVEEEINPGDSDHDVEEDLTGLTCRKRRRVRKKKLRERLRKAKDVDSLPDFEDVIGKDLPVKFKYRQVVPNDFGLSVEEILLADDKELNRWASLKTTVAFRDEWEEQRDIKRFNSKRNDLKHKQRILKSLFKKQDETTASESKKKKKRRKKKASLIAELSNEDADDDAEVVDSGSKVDQEKGESVTEDKKESEVTGKTDSKSNVKHDKKKSRKRKRASTSSKSNCGLDIDRLKAYGFSRNEMKRKKLL